MFYRIFFSCSRLVSNTACCYCLVCHAKAHSCVLPYIPLTVAKPVFTTRSAGEPGYVHRHSCVYHPCMCAIYTCMSMSYTGTRICTLAPMCLSAVHVCHTHMHISVHRDSDIRTCIIHMCMSKYIQAPMCLLSVHVCHTLMHVSIRACTSVPVVCACLITLAL